MEITQALLDYAKETLSKYKQVDILPDVLKGRTVIHMYPVADTKIASGDLEGFIDALFADVYVYMCDSMTFYIIRSRDEVDLRLPARVRIFKDGSTMIIIDRDITIRPYQSMVITDAGTNGSLDE